ncbi:MAG: hypothetical protein ACTSXD_11760 [Candidatus Heimdallarchaeaceae archaeon]
MKIAFISSICAIEEISSLGDIEFCLAPYCKYPKYKQYFIDRKKKGRYIIMDNGVAENNLISAKKLVDLAIKIKVNEIIIPDKIGDYERTTRKRQRFLERYYDILKKNNIKIQGVIQGNTIYEYIKATLELEEDNRIDVIGIPFRMNYTKFNNMTKDENHMWNRLMFLNYINVNKPIHLLGNNLPSELLWITNPRIRSCDSKLMARYGLNNQFWKFDDSSKPKKKLYIDSKMTSKQIEIAIRNINMLKRELK